MRDRGIKWSAGWHARVMACALLLAAAVWPASAQEAASSPAVPRAVSRVPTQLADSTFWRLVTELSEPAGWFRSENAAGR